MSTETEQPVAADPAVVSIDPAEIIAVIDTNVMIDILSCHDYRNKLDPARAAIGDKAWLDPDVEYRGKRARDALLLGIHLAKTRAITWGSQGELLERLDALVPPAPGKPGGLNWNRDYTTQIAHVVLDRILRGWTHGMPKPPETERGNDADRWLVAEAKRLNVPLLSNEGLKRDGTSTNRS